MKTNQRIAKNGTLKLWKHGENSFKSVVWYSDSRRRSKKGKAWSQAS